MVRHLIVFLCSLALLLNVRGFPFPEGEAKEPQKGLISTVAGGMKGGIDTTGKVSNITLDYIKGGTGYGTGLLTRLSSAATGYGKRVIGTLADFKSYALTAGSGLVNKTLDTADTLTDGVPVVGTVVKKGASLGKDASGYVEKKGQTGIEGFKKYGIKANDFLDSGVQKSADLINRGVGGTVSYGKIGVGKSEGAANYIVDNGEKLANGAADRVSKLADKIPSILPPAPNKKDDVKKDAKDDKEKST